MATIATSTHVSISPSNTGLWKIQQDDETAQCTGELLKEDLAVNSLPIF